MKISIATRATFILVGEVEGLIHQTCSKERKQKNYRPRSTKWNWTGKKIKRTQRFTAPEKQVLKTVRCMSMRLANVVKVPADTSCTLEIHDSGTWQHILWMYTFVYFWILLVFVRFLDIWLHDNSPRTEFCMMKLIVVSHCLAPHMSNRWIPMFDIVWSCLSMFTNRRVSTLDRR